MDWLQKLFELTTDRNIPAIVLFALILGAFAFAVMNYSNRRLRARILYFIRPFHDGVEREDLLQEFSHVQQYVLVPCLESLTEMGHITDHGGLYRLTDAGTTWLAKIMNSPRATRWLRGK